MDIIKKVDILVKKHGTRNPFKISHNEGFNIRLKDYSDIKGYFYTALKRKFIVINCNLDELSRHIVCAHELGHGILHNIEKTQFLKEYTLFPVHSKTEREANAFAAELILADGAEASSYYNDGHPLGDDIFKKLMEIKSKNRRCLNGKY